VNKGSQCQLSHTLELRDIDTAAERLALFAQNPKLHTAVDESDENDTE
jgi:hypothetical protein